MRLSDFVPRINGIVPAATIPRLSGVGDTLVGTQLALATINSALQSFLASLPWGVTVGNATPPDQFLVALQYDVTNACTNVTSASEACDPNSATIQAAVQAAYQQYLSAYNTQVQTTAQQVAAGTIVVPPSYILPPNYAPNTLNTVAPAPTVVQTGQSTGNVLAPPVPMPPVTAGQVLNNQTQGGSTAIYSGTTLANAQGQPTSWFNQSTLCCGGFFNLPNWMVLGAAGAVLLLVMKD